MADDTDDGPSAWGRTLREANEMAADLRERGWDVVTVRAGHAAPVPPRESDRFGLVYVAPDGVADSLPALAADADFDRYEVFRRRVGSDLFLLTRLTDPAACAAVLLVGTVDRSAADPLLDAVRERGVVHTRVELLDGTELIAVEHDDPSAFFPALA